MKGEKIQALNYAIADMLPHLAAWERDQEQAQVLVRVVAFATEPRWHIRDPVPVSELRWKPLQPVRKGLTNMGPAFALVADALTPGPLERSALRPALLLITDGMATDPPAIRGRPGRPDVPAGRAAALRLAVAIGRDAQSDALARFTGDPGVPVLVADSTEDIADRLVAVSLAVSRMSEVGADRGVLARQLLGAPADVPSRDLRPGHDHLTAMADQMRPTRRPAAWRRCTGMCPGARPHGAPGLPNEDAVALPAGLTRAAIVVAVADGHGHAATSAAPTAPSWRWRRVPGGVPGGRRPCRADAGPEAEAAAARSFRGPCSADGGGGRRHRRRSRTRRRSWPRSTAGRRARDPLRLDPARRPGRRPVAGMRADRRR